ncbi:MAG: adhesin [Oscillospiraceae bacterium]|nr:adhesin [Oscillospiraceae bacterium]
MATVCRTAKEFAEAVKNNEEYITIEGDLKNGILRIKATGKVAWGVCVASLAVAITAIAVAPAGGGAPAGAGLVMAAPAAATLGTAVVPAIAIGVCAGGVGVLNALRDKYRIVEKNDKYITLKRK